MIDSRDTQIVEFIKELPRLVSLSCFVKKVMVSMYGKSQRICILTTFAFTSQVWPPESLSSDWTFLSLGGIYVWETCTYV